MALLRLQLAVARTVVEALHLAHGGLRRVRLVEVQTDRTVHELHLHLHQLLAQVAVDHLAVLVHALLSLHDGARVHHLVQHRPVLHRQRVHGLQQRTRLLDDHVGHRLLQLLADRRVHPLQHRVQHARQTIVLHCDVQRLQLQIRVLDLQLRLLVHHTQLERDAEHGLRRTVPSHLRPPCSSRWPPCPCTSGRSACPPSGGSSSS